MISLLYPLSKPPCKKYPLSEVKISLERKSNYLAEGAYRQVPSFGEALEEAFEDYIEEVEEVPNEKEARDQVGDHAGEIYHPYYFTLVI